MIARITHRKQHRYFTAISNMAHQLPKPRSHDPTLSFGHSVSALVDSYLKECKIAYCILALLAVLDQALIGDIHIAYRLSLVKRLWGLYLRPLGPWETSEIFTEWTSGKGFETVFLDRL